MKQSDAVRLAACFVCATVISGLGAPSAWARDGKNSLSTPPAPTPATPALDAAQRSGAQDGAAARTGARTRAAIEDVLVRMGETIRAADIEGYLRCVDESDRVFHVEQRAWAKDLQRGAPESVRLSIADGGEKAAEFGENHAAFDLETVWKFPDWKNERRVRARVVFRKAAGANGEWKFAGEDWEVMENEAGKVMYMGKDFESHARLVLEALPEVRAHVEEGFEVALGHRQEVKVYPRMDHLQWSIYLRYTDGLAGWNEPGESVKLLGDDKPRRRDVVGVLAHEMGHCATFAMGEHANEMAWWILEGVAELAAERYESGKARGVDAMVRSWAAMDGADEDGGDEKRGGRRGGLAEWEDLADFHTVEARWQGHVYVQGQHMAGYISQRWKRSGRNEWLKAMAAGKSLEESTQSVMGMSFADLDASWRESLRENDTEDGAAATSGKDAAGERGAE